MKKVLKKIGIVLLILIILFILFVLISYINHKIQLGKEDELFNNSIGEMVEVNGHLMNVYCEGKGDKTLVFMSGGGTCSPVLDFKSLYSLLSDSYRVVVIEKAGYGFSEVVDVDRDIDTVLSETRQALKLSGIEGPYVLCPHSMSGIEALYWAQIYPEEVTAIVGLDMAVPQAYENYNISMLPVRFASAAANTGIIRWFPSFSESDAIKYGTLSEEEKELYRTIFYRRTATETMLIEIEEIKSSAKKVMADGAPTVPILMFLSNGQNTGWDEITWRGFQKNYIQSCKSGTLVELNCSHYVHDIEYEKIAKEIKTYMTNLQK